LDTLIKPAADQVRRLLGEHQQGGAMAKPDRGPFRPSQLHDQLGRSLFFFSQDLIIGFLFDR
jgi:hypothetical protein